MSEEEMFEATEARSTPSIHSAIDRSVENIAHRKSRVSSQENGKLVGADLLRPLGNIFILAEAGCSKLSVVYLIALVD